jgi:hypothetical protein
MVLHPPPVNLQPTGGMIYSSREKQKADVLKNSSFDKKSLGFSPNEE